MTTKRFLAGATIVLIAAAYIAGYWPEHSRRLVFENEAAAFRARLDDAEARVRVSALLGELLHISETVASMNYGQAQTRSSAFFDEVRSEAASTPVAELRSALQTVLQGRDGITASLSRGDQAALEPLRALQIELRGGLGYPIPPTDPPPAR